MKLTDLLIPRSAPALPPIDPAVEVARRHLDGLTIPDPVDLWLYAPGYIEGPEPADDEAWDAFMDAGGVHVSAAWQAEHRMDHDERAAAIVAEVRRVEAVPGVWSWRRWTITDRVVRWSYSFGFGPNVSGMTWDRFGQRYVTGPLHLVWPATRVHWVCDGEPRVSWRMGYLFGRPGWWWACWWRQVRHGSVRHWPEEPWAFGVCAACARCGTCGAHRECDPGCPEVAG